MDAGKPTPLERIATALERLADHFAPVEEKHEKRPAVLSTAIYDREERERKALRETLRQQESQSPRRVVEKA